MLSVCMAATQYVSNKETKLKLNEEEKQTKCVRGVAHTCTYYYMIVHINVAAFGPIEVQTRYDDFDIAMSGPITVPHKIITYDDVQYSNSMSSLEYSHRTYCYVPTRKTCICTSIRASLVC